MWRGRSWSIDSMHKSAYTLVVNFRWDARKATANLKKHGIAFEDAIEVFYGFCLSSEDRREDYPEERFITIGMTGGDVLVLAHTVESDADTIRIISARKAEPHECKTYLDAYFKEFGC